MFPNGAKVIILKALFINVFNGFNVSLAALPHTAIPYLAYELTSAWKILTNVLVFDLENTRQLRTFVLTYGIVITSMIIVLNEN